MDVNVHPISELDSVLSERFARATDHAASGDWVGVERRSEELVPKRRPRRSSRYRARVALAAAVAVVALAAPALALDGVVVRVFDRGSTAPEVVRVSLDHWLNDVLPPTARPGVKADEARRVYTFTAESGAYALYMAPAQSGYCWGLERVAAACETRGGPILSPVWSDFPPDGDPAPMRITGPINSADAERLVLSFEDGTTAEIPFILVSNPINAAFFYYEVPAKHTTRGQLPSMLVAYGGESRVLGSKALVYGN